jgi:CMP-N-acetylneuraminic acid synthetase
VRYRHPVLSDDEVQTASVVFDVLAWRHYQDDSFCVLNPSTPTRDSLLLESLHDNFTDCDCLMTVLAKTREHEGTALFCKTLPFLRTLDFYKLNIKSVPMFLSVDINTEADFRRAECILLS